MTHYSIEEKKEKTSEQLEQLLSAMADFFNCSQSDVKISKITFHNGRYTAALSYRYADKERSDLRKIITSIYYFDIEGEFLEKEGIWYEGIFYDYENLIPFFEVISQEIGELKNK